MKIAKCNMDMLVPYFFACYQQHFSSRKTQDDEEKRRTAGVGVDEKSTEFGYKPLGD